MVNPLHPAHNPQISGAINDFKNAGSLADKAAAARRIQALQNDPNLPPQSQQMVADYANSLKLPEFLDNTKLVTDLKRIGATARTFSGMNDMSDETYQDLLQDPDLHPDANDVLRSCASYHPQCKGVVTERAELIDKKNQGIELSEKEKEPIVRDYDGKGTTIEEVGTKVKALGPDGDVLFSGDDRDDPRAVDISAKYMESFLMGDEKSEKKFGTSIASAQHGSTKQTSVMMKKLNADLANRAMSLDHDRASKMIRYGQERVMNAKQVDMDGVDLKKDEPKNDIDL